MSTLTLRPPSGAFFNPVEFTTGDFAALNTIADWILTELPDDRQESMPNGLRRATEQRKPAGSTLIPGSDDQWTGQTEVARDSDGSVKRLNTTSLALALDFLSRMSPYRPDLLGNVEAFARALMTFQYRDPTTLRQGGFADAPDFTPASSFPAGLAGTALLNAWEATGKTKPEYFEAAKLTGQFLVRLADPNSYWPSKYSIANPITRTSAGQTWYGFCDRVDANDKLSTTASTWNLAGAEFLKRIADLLGDTTWANWALNARDFMAYGALNARDYFAVSTTTDATYVTAVWPNDSNHNYNDAAWHKLGDFAGTGTAGTDGIEYGMASLLRLGYSETLLRAAYDAYIATPHSDPAGLFGSVFNPRICFTGYLRPAGWYGSYYDSQGAGTLGGFKAKLYPDHFELSRPMLELLANRGSLLNGDLTTQWSTASGGWSFATKGVIVIAQAGLALLDALEGVA